MNDVSGSVPADVTPEVFAAALAACGRSYSPYSHYPVGAAVRTATGEIGPALDDRKTQLPRPEDLRSQRRRLPRPGGGAVHRRVHRRL